MPHSLLVEFIHYCAKIRELSEDAVHAMKVRAARNGQSLLRKELDAGHVHKAAVVALEGDRHGRRRAVPVLGDNEVGFPCTG